MDIFLKYLKAFLRKQSAYYVTQIKECSKMFNYGHLQTEGFVLTYNNKNEMSPVYSLL